MHIAHFIRVSAARTSHTSDNITIATITVTVKQQTVHSQPYQAAHRVDNRRRWSCFFSFSLSSCVFGCCFFWKWWFVFVSYVLNCVILFCWLFTFILKKVHLFTQPHRHGETRVVAVYACITDNTQHEYSSGSIPKNLPPSNRPYTLHIYTRVHTPSHTAPHKRNQTPSYEHSNFEFCPLSYGLLQKKTFFSIITSIRMLCTS